MLNQVVLVGRLTKEIKVLKSLESEKKYANIIIAIPRAFKNMNGEYETDFIHAKLWDSVAENTAEYCKKGDIIGIKGRLEQVGKQQLVIAEKVTFLSSRKSEDNE